MKTELTDDALELGRVMDTALAKAGGADLARAAEAGTGIDEVATILDRLGLWDLRPRESAEDGEAAAAACRSAGRVALPYPVAERLAADPDAGFDAVAVATGPVARVNLIGLAPELNWVVSDGRARRAPVVSAGPVLGTKLGPLVSEVELGTWESDDSAPLALLLPCWTLLGMLESALDKTRQHMLDRKQFDQPIASFQALQFRLADTTTTLQGFQELAKYTLWSVLSGQPGAAVDVLACRVSALETAETVFRTAHQMHGAMGFCDEVDLSWLSRHSQAIRRLPWGLSPTRKRLLDGMATVPFAGLYGEGLVGAGDHALF
ncbi:acyl-CoA dehydrogenase family protein [Pseudonocardia sp. RS010]|uniref:acyl-CoA dehydrogenase family protein n=1 Tax=Pseudonocardia sp. RS010 TaxID=3385979 RepID=UPI00399FABF0